MTEKHPDHLQPAPEPELHSDADVSVTHSQLNQVIEQLNTLTCAFNDGSTQSKPRITSKSRKWKAFKWAGGILVAGATAIFGIGVAYQKTVGDNATKTHVEDSIETHRVHDFIPLKVEVTEFKKEMEPIKKGVTTLVEDRNKERAVKKAKRKLNRYDKDYQEALQEYTADKAAGRRAGPRPRKKPYHIDLEEEVQELEDAL